MKEIYDPNTDPYLGVTVNGYTITHRVGAGKIGFVYRAEKNKFDFVACKVIPEGKLKNGWEVEVQKVQQLNGVPSVIEYKLHGSDVDKKNRHFTWILWNFVEGQNLRDFISKQPDQINLPLISLIAEKIMDVLYACQQLNIRHGDLHEGNILISVPDNRLRNKTRRIYVSDFGYGGSHNNVQPKDDFKQLYSIVLRLLSLINPATLTPAQKIWHNKIELFAKNFTETNPTQKAYTGDLSAQIEAFSKLKDESQNEADLVKKGIELKTPGDYLWAEALGYKIEEWKNLFVPEFLGAKDLLSQNITVLTGARGCGKTMTFRRLTAYMDKVIGEPSGVKGSDQFIGFYLNSRFLLEAFPYIPKVASNALNAQLLNYFHLAWLSEILRTFSVHTEIDQVNNYGWLEKIIQKLFSFYKPLPEGGNVLANLSAFVEKEKERCRVSDFRKGNSPSKWPLSKFDFLDDLCIEIKSNVPFMKDKPFYFFLDDYTIPIVKRNVQRIFKISTESVISFDRTLARGKPLQLVHDFDLLDLAHESLLMDEKDKWKILDAIFKKRIERDEDLKGSNSNLVSLLGRRAMDNNTMAKTMREKKKKVHYSGIESFVGVWSSDIRMMIAMFVEMLRDSRQEFKKGNKVISPYLQDKIFKQKGGEFLDFAEQVPNPMSLEKQINLEKNIQFGTHLRSIVEAFILICKYEMMEGKIVSNNNHENPKQAFRIEILDHFELDPKNDEEALGFYEGLIRWHIFLQDRRGKSLRGFHTPRLFMNRILIPRAMLTFSEHDNIHLNILEFKSLLTKPNEFVKYYKDKRRKQHKEQLKMNFHSKPKK
jgi:hypothetical protein